MWSRSSGVWSSSRESRSPGLTCSRPSPSIASTARVSASAIAAAPVSALICGTASAAERECSPTRRWGRVEVAACRAVCIPIASGALGSRGAREDRVAMLLPPTPETAAAFFATWKLGAILLSMSVLYGDEGIRHRLIDSGAKVLLTNAANAERMESSLVEQVLILDDQLLQRGSTAFDVVDTAADDPAQLYYSSGTTGLAKGILHAHRYILAHEEFLYCHDVRDNEVFHGMGEWA